MMNAKYMNIFDMMYLHDIIMRATSHPALNGSSVRNGACRNPTKWSHNDINKASENKLLNLELFVSLDLKS